MDEQSIKKRAIEEIQRKIAPQFPTQSLAWVRAEASERFEKAIRSIIRNGYDEDVERINEPHDVAIYLVSVGICRATALALAPFIVAQANEFDGAD